MPPPLASSRRAPRRTRRTVAKCAGNGREKWAGPVTPTPARARAAPTSMRPQCVGRGLPVRGAPVPARPCTARRTQRAARAASSGFGMPGEEAAPAHLTTTRRDLAAVPGVPSRRPRLLCRRSEMGRRVAVAAARARLVTLGAATASPPCRRACCVAAAGAARTSQRSAPASAARYPSPLAPAATHRWRCGSCVPTPAVAEPSITGACAGRPVLPPRVTRALGSAGDLARGPTALGRDLARGRFRTRAGRAA